MNNQPTSNGFTDARAAARHSLDFQRALSIALISSTLLTLNVLLALHFLDLSAFSDSAWPGARPTDWMGDYDGHLWIGVNGILIGFYLLLGWRYAAPLKHVMQMLRQTSILIEQQHQTSAPSTHVRTSDAAIILQEMRQLAMLVQEQMLRRHELMRELETTRQVLAQFTLQQDTMVQSTNREMITQYRNVISYANYLDEHIQKKAISSDLRFDFDDICESGFNLKLIAGSLEILRSDAVITSQPVSLANLMQQTMLALAPSLDRRTMRLTTAEVDESIHAIGDPKLLLHVIWMLLLGTVRYAEAESALKMRCLYDRDKKHTLMSIVISQLSPGSMSVLERSKHLARQIEQDNPHMFAETIKIHANVQLAELLLARQRGSISVVPLSPYACEICVILPAT